MNRKPLLSRSGGTSVARVVCAVAILMIGSTDASAFVVPQGVDLNLVIQTATPVADCRDVSNPDRAIAACTTVNASKNLARRTRASALLNRCAAYQNKGMLDKAIADCSRAAEHDPSNPDAFYNRGRAWRKKGDPARAIADYDQAIRLSPRSALARAKAFNSRGDAYAALKQLDRALADFDAAIRLDSRYAKAFLNRGAIRSRRGEHAGAIADYTEAFRLDSSLSRALAARGNSHWRMGNTAQATADYREALRIDPEDVDTERNLARVSGAGGSAGDAPSEAKQAQVQPD